MSADPYTVCLPGIREVRGRLLVEARWQRLTSRGFAAELGYEVTVVKDATTGLFGSAHARSSHHQSSKLPGAIVTINEVVDSISSRKALEMGA